MCDNRKKILNILYIFAIVSLVSGLFINLFYIIYATTESSAEIASVFPALNWVCLSFLAITLSMVFINIFMNNKFFWLEIVMAGFSVLMLIVVIACCAKTFNGSLYVSYEMIRFEILGSLSLLLISRLGCYFSDKKEVKNEEN